MEIKCKSNEVTLTRIYDVSFTKLIKISIGIAVFNFVINE